MGRLYTAEADFFKAFRQTSKPENFKHVRDELMTFYSTLIDNPTMDIAEAVNSDNEDHMFSDIDSATDSECDDMEGEYLQIC